MSDLIEVQEPLISWAQVMGDQLLRVMPQIAAFVASIEPLMKSARQRAEDLDMTYEEYLDWVGSLPTFLRLNELNILSNQT